MQGALKLRYARRRAGLTQRQLAALSGIPQPAIARIESGRVTPRLDTFDRLLRACGVTSALAPILGRGLDRTVIRQLVKMTPRGRLDLAVDEANNLARLGL